MALTTTYSTGAVALGATRITLNAYTAPSAGPNGPLKVLRWATGEYALITDDSLSPTLIVVPGWNGSRNVAHSAREGVQYGLANDTSWPAGPAAVVQIAPVTITNAQEITLTGTTGTDAAVVTAPWPAFINASGASGAGMNLPVPVVGAQYVVKNSSSGTMKIYCVGGSINGTTGTTAVSMTTTGATGDLFWCATAGAWQGAPTSV
jgi:hypothetical protein